MPFQFLNLLGLKILFINDLLSFLSFYAGICAENNLPPHFSSVPDLPKKEKKMVHVSDEMFERQLKLEREMEEVGAENAARHMVEARDSKLETGTLYGSILLKRGVDSFATAIKDFLKKEMNKPRGRVHTAAKLLRELPDMRVAAFLALRQVLNGISSKHSLMQTALVIAETIQKEVRLVKFKRDHSALYKSVTKRIKSHHERHRFVSIKVIMKRNGVDCDSAWSLNERTQLGIKLIDIMASSTGYIEIIATKRPKDRLPVNYIKVTDKCLIWIDSCRDTALMNPDYLPCIIPPKAWESPFSGGYYSNIKPLWLVKARFNPRNYLEELANKKDEMQTVYKAVNAIQETAYRINKRVYDVMSALWEAGGGTAGLPEKEDGALPLCPICGGVMNYSGRDRNHLCFEDEKNKDAFKSWKREAENVYDRNASRVGKKILLSKILYLAEKFKNEEAIYFPCQLDFRGRVYPVTGFLHPQGSDTAKGLLEFAEGKPLIDMAAVRWLAIHGANLYGEDKISLEDRFLWVLEHEENIKAAASEPLNNSWWRDASDPFQFLAFCFEWALYTDACERGEVFLSHIPVAMDGSCNGLQIFSLLLKDEEGGRATNLLPSETPQDIYGIVASKVRDKLREKAETGEKRHAKSSGRELYDEKEIASLMLELGIDRKTTKRQVMTLPYGATFTSCKDYTNEWLISKRDEVPDSPLFSRYEKTHDIALFLGSLIWEAIHETVKAAKGAMEYLRIIAGLAAAEQLPITWRTPVGFTVMQAYKETKSKRIKCELGGKLVFMSANEETLKIDAAEQKNAISPNFIHSLDAAAMMKTVEIASCKGVSAFAMVHDSYATHAACAAKLAESLREAFAELFKGDLLEVFCDEVSAILSAESLQELPPPPEKGTLDISRLKNSDYFFA